MRAFAVLIVGVLLSPIAAVLAQQAAPSTRLAAHPGNAKFQEMCAGCHAADGSGLEAPSLVDGIWLHGADEDSITRAIRDGLGEKMRGYKDRLSDADIKTLVAYVNLARLESVRGPANVSSAMPIKIPQGAVRTERHDFRVEHVATVGTPVEPQEAGLRLTTFGMDFLPDGRLLVTEIAGKLWIVDKGKVSDKPIEGIPQPKPGTRTRPLLDVLVDPDYRNNGWIYLTTADDQVNMMNISRGRLKDGRWVDNTTVLTYKGGGVAGYPGASTARLAMDKRRYLYLATETIDFYGKTPPELLPAQDLADPRGKVLRMHEDGRLPADNPFVGRQGAYPYIWTLGHRVPLGIAVDAKGNVWETENGPRGGDELNHVIGGKNYGWPIATWGHPYDGSLVPSSPDKPGFEAPVLAWVPSPATSSIAFYAGAAFPAWKDNLLLGSLKQRSLYRIVFDGTRAVVQETLLHDFARIRDIAVSPNGEIYLMADTGEVMRMVPARAGARSANAPSR